MKKPFLILFFLLPFFCISQVALKISADIRGRSCGGGLGLCSKSDVSKAEISHISIIKISENSVEMVFDKNNLSLAEQQSLVAMPFSKLKTSETYFLNQQTNLILDESLLTELTINPKLKIIKAGKYFLKIDADKIYVILHSRPKVFKKQLK